MTSLLTTTLFTAASAAALTLQERQGEATHLPSTEIVGLTVLAEPEPEADDETPDAIGEVVELLAHSESGRVRGVIVEDDAGALRRIAWSDWLVQETDEDEITARFLGTAGEFGDLPEVDPALIRTRLLSPSGDALPPEAGGTDGEGDGKGEGEGEGEGDETPETEEPRRYECRVTELSGLEVFGPGELHGYGEVTGAAIECETGRISHLTVKRGEHVHPVPLPALLIRSVFVDPSPDTDVLAVVTKLGANAVEAGPAIDEEAGRTVRSSEFREEVDKYYADRIDL